MLDWFLKRKDRTVGGPMESGFPLAATGRGGLLAGTQLASGLGWRPAEALAAGDQVLTFDHGMQTVVEVQRETILVAEGELAPGQCPLLIPRDALGNRVEMWVMPDQGILLESELVADAQGDPFAVAPACTLEGYRGIRRVHPGARLELVMPRFARDEVIYLEAGLLGYAPAPRGLLEGDAGKGLYHVLPPEEARGLVLGMIAEEEAWMPDLPFVPQGSGQMAAMM
ncbi:Hint domain-containing protein [Roseobacteraceae bacterium NS-SX3]